MSYYQLELYKEGTPNKAVWALGKFKLYIPLTRCPTDLPSSIRVKLEPLETLPQQNQYTSDCRVETVVVKVDRCSETIRYRPLGNDKDWLIGEPYIPIDLLPNPVPEYVRVIVDWNKQSGE